MEQTTVAIIDNEPVLCDGLSTYLEGLPEFRVVGTALSAASAEHLVMTRHPEVIVLGVEIDTSKSADLIRRLHNLDDRPAVVVVASQDDRDSAAAALRQGASGFVLKAAPIEDLVAAIHWARRGEMWISPTLLTALFAGTTQASHGIPRDDRLRDLTDREIQILELLVEGAALKEISKRLHIAINTVRTHTRNIQMKLQVHSNVAAVSVALSGGLRPK